MISMKQLRRRKWWLGIVLAMSGGYAGYAAAQDSPFLEGPNGQTPATKPADTPAQPAPPANDGRIEFEMRGKRWNDVLEWLTEKTGLPFVGVNIPSGTFTFISPRKAGAPAPRYTIPEIIDIINEALIDQHYLLIRKTATMTIVPVDERNKLSVRDLPRVRVDELSVRGQTELVQVTIQLHSLVAESFANSARRILGAEADVVAIPEANELVITDTVGKIQRFLDNIKSYEANVKDAGTVNHICKYIRARDAARTLKNLFIGEEPRSQDGQPDGATGGRFRGGRGGPDRGDRGGGGMPNGIQFSIPGGGGFDPSAMFNLGGMRPQQGAAAKPAVSIDFDEQSNAVIVIGAPDKLGQARALLEKWDVGLPGQKEIERDKPPVTNSYPVPTGTADGLASFLRERYHDSKVIRIQSVGGSSIVATAVPIDQAEIAQSIDDFNKKTQPTSTETVDCTLDPNDLTDQLKNIFGDAIKNPGQGIVYIEANHNKNAVDVNGTPGQVANVKEVIHILDPETKPGAANPNSRVITLQQGSSASILAEEIAKHFKELGRPNAVEIHNPGIGAKQVKPMPEPRPPQQDPSKQPMGYRQQNDGPWRNMDVGGVKTYPIAATDDQAPAQPANPQAPQNQQQQKAAPVRIVASGNQLIVQSDDPDAIKAVADIARMLTSRRMVPGEFEIVHLKNAMAIDAARVIDEAFNGPKEPRQSPLSPFGGRISLNNFPFAGAGAQVPSDPKPQRVRVVADTTSNSLLIQASPLDLLMIKSLLARAIDTEPEDARGAIKAHKIGPLVYASAYKVSDVVSRLYADQTGNNRQARISGFFQAANADPNQPQKPPALQIGVDDDANTIYVSCSDTLYKEIQTVVDQMEEAAKNSTRAITIVPTSGVDPTTVYQVMEAIQGRMTSSQGFGGGNGFGGNGFGGGGFNGGGFGGRGGGGFGGAPGGGFGGGNFVAPVGGFGGGGFGGAPGGGFGGMGGRGMGGGPGGGFGGAPGGGFGGGGGRGMGGGPGGGFGGGNFGGGGGRGAGGGGMGGGGRGGGRGGGGRQSNTPPGGISFFEQRDMDVPGFSAFYDPQQDTSPLYLAYDGEEQQQPPAGFRQPGVPALPPGQVRPPRGNVTTVPLPELGGVIVSAADAEDFKLAVKIVELLQDRAKSTKIVFEVYPLKTADSTNVSSIITQLFQRFAPSASGANFNRPTGGNPLANFLQQQTQLGSVLLYPLVRQNAIMIGAPANIMKEVEAEINRLDIPTRADSQAVPFPLQRAAASQVAQQIEAWATTRYNDTNNVRVTFDNSSNTVFIQASPDDMDEIRRLIKWIDNTISPVINELRIVKLKNSLSDELANTLLEALSQVVVNPTANGAGVVAAPTAGPGGFGTPTAPRPATTTPTFGAPGTPGGGTGGAGSVGVTGTTTGATNKSVTIKFQSGKPGSEAIYGGMLDDVHFTSEPRSNSLILIAPEKTMDLLLKLVADLDVVAAARAEINVFPLKRADAAQVSQVLQQMFLGTTGTGAAGAGPGGTTGATGRVLLTGDQANPGDGSVLIQLRVAVDNRSNSLIVAGSRNDLEVVGNIVARLDDDPGRDRIRLAFKMRNQAAADVATAIQTFYTNALAPLTDATYAGPYQYLLREVVAVPESVSNTVLVDASPKYADEIKRIIDQLDEVPGEVAVEVTMAGVTLNDDLEFGAQISGQSPVLFDRGVGTTSAANPGFNFNAINSTTQSLFGTAPTTILPSGTLVSNALAQPNLIGVAGLNQFGVGTSSTTGGPGGFIFSASSASVNILVRALKNQQRIEVIDNSTLITMDNQAARINSGVDFPFASTVSITATGIVTPSIDRRVIGVILTVTPRISPNNRVVMRVTPEVSSVQSTSIPIAAGVTGTSFNVQNIDTTVGAYDGETVVLGGIITKSQTKSETKVPILGDIPVLGALWRYRTDTTQRQELFIIMTPHIMRTPDDKARFLAAQRNKYHYNACDMARIHTDFTEVSAGFHAGDPTLSPAQRIMTAPLPSGDAPASPQPGVALPAPRIVPQPMPQPPGGPATGGPVTQSNAVQYGATDANGAHVLLAPQNGSTNTTGKESQSWMIVRPQPQ